MKYLPIIIFMFGGVGKVKSDNCSTFKISHIEESHLKDHGEPFVTYINNLDKEDQFTLKCYNVNGQESYAIITSIGSKLVVMIKNIPCLKRKSLTESTYMHLKIGKHLTREHQFLAYGIFNTATKEWCRYDIGLDVKVVNKKSYNKPENVKLWNWSENGIKISPDPDTNYRLEAKNGLTVDYVSDGLPKFVLNCFHDNTAILRSPMGQRIAKIENLACATNGASIQTFYVYSQVEFTNMITKRVYRLAELNLVKPGKKYDSRFDLPWYAKHVRDDKTSLSRYYWLFYFTTAIGGGMNCYWHKVDVDIPNSCPSLPDESMIFTRREYENIHNDYKMSAVAKYTSSDDERVVLTCFKSEKDQALRFYSVMTTVSGYYLVSFNSIDCSVKGNFNQMLSTQLTFDEKTEEDSEIEQKVEHIEEYFTIGKRSTIDEDWCSYSVHKLFETELHAYSTVYKWVYYTHKPNGQWKEHSTQCDEFNGKIIAGAYKLSAAFEDFSPLRYIWVADGRSNVYFLQCHRDKDPSTGKEFYIGIIKTLQGENVFSIVGFECWTNPNSKEKHYMMITTMDQHQYVSVGLRGSAEKEWCRYEVCVDCKDKTPKLQMDGNPYGKLIIWSDDAVPWRRGLKKDYEYKMEDVENRFISEGKTKFLLFCMKNTNPDQKGGTKQENLMRSASGAFIARVGFTCESPPKKIFKWLFFFVTESMDGKLSLHTSQDCGRGCLEDVDKQGTIKESWLYYYAAETSDQYEPSTFHYTFKESAEDCRYLLREHIKPTFNKDPNTPGRLLTEYRTGKKFNFKISCYVVEEGDKLTYYTDIAYKGNPLVRIDGLNCKSRERIERLAVSTILGNDDISQVVIASKDCGTTNCWCSYNVMKLPDSDSYEVQRYYGYDPDELTLEWYENSPYVNCPSLKKDSITVKKWNCDNAELKDTEVKTYVGVLNDEYIMLHCFMNIVLDKQVYTSVFTSMDKEGDFSVTVKGLDCASKSDLKNFYIYFWNPADLKYMILETKVAPESDFKVCRYDIDLDMDNPQVFMNLKNILETNVFVWSEAGILLNSRPSFMDKLTAIDEDKNVIDETNLIKVYYSKHFILNFLTRCYKKNDKYFSVITSTRGLHFGTIPEYNCLEYRIHNAYMHFKTGNRIDFSGDLKAVKKQKEGSTKIQKNHLCWYYSCQTPNEPTERIQMFYFFQKYDDSQLLYHAKKKKTYKLTMSKRSSGPFPLFTRNQVYKLFVTKRQLLYTISDWWPIESFEEKYDWCSSLKNDKIRQFDTIQDSQQLSLVAKYVRKNFPKIELHCYIKVGQDKINYFYTIANVYGKPMFSMVDHDCSPNDKGQPEAQLFVAVDEEYQDNGKDLFFVGNSNCWISIVHCPSCGTVEINTLYGYAPNDQYYWEQVPTKVCPKFKPTDIFKEHAFPLEEDPFILHARYMNNHQENDFGQYVLHCYIHQHDDDDNDEDDDVMLHVIVLKTLQGKYLVSIKGLDCSSGFHLHSPTHISLKKEEKKLILVAGSRTVVQQSTGPWCLYEACLNCDTLQVSTTVDAPEESFQWSEMGIKVDICPSLDRSAFGPELKESTVVAEYVDVLLLECHKDHNGNWFIQIQTNSGFFIMTIPLKQNCDDEKQNLLVREFYVHMTEDNKIFTMTSPNIEDLVQTCWNSGQEKIPPDSWFYYFPKRKGSELYKKLEDSERNCPIIQRNSIILKKITEEEVKNALNVEYWNGGHPKLKLTFYKTNDINDDGTSKESNFATISSEGKEEVFKVENLNTLVEKFLVQKDSMLDRVIYAEYIEDNSLIIGSSEKEGDWCWYKVYYYKNIISNVLKIDYQPKHAPSQWYKREKEDCTFMKWENIHTEEDDMLSSKDPESIQIGYVHLEDQTTNILKEVFVTYMYSRENPDKTGEKVCTMVIRNDRGRHLARIDQMECSQAWTLFMFRYAAYQDYLIFGGISVSNNVRSVCQYDICITCQEKNVRLNSHFPTDQEKTAIRWVKGYEKIADKAPSPKHSDAKFKDEKTVTRYRSKKTPLLYLDCHKTGSANSLKYYGVLRTYTELIIGTIQKENCENSNHEIHFRYLLSKSKDGSISVHDLGMTDPPEKETGSCWFYGCDTSPINEMLVFYDLVPRPQQSVTNPQPGIWDLVQLQCFTSNKENLITDESLIDLNGYEVDGSYINEDEDDENVFILQCLSKQGGGDDYARLDSLNGKPIVFLRKIDCTTLEKLTAHLYMAIVRAGEHRYLAVGTLSAVKGKFSPWCRYDVCLDCQKTDDRVHVNIEADPVNLLIFKWSTGSSEAIPKLRDYASYRNNIVKHKHRKHTDISAECYYDSTNFKKHSVIRLGNTPLAVAVYNECIARNVLFRTFYIYTSYKDSKYSLFRMGQEKEVEPELMENVVDKLFFLFTEKDAPEKRPWKQVVNPKVVSADVYKDGIGEKNVCFPQPKPIEDLINRTFKAKDDTLF